jgi:hypothetical protein
MKSIKTLVIALVLGLGAVVYASGGSQPSAQNEADCCVVGASCCTGDECCATHNTQ